MTTVGFLFAAALGLQTQESVKPYPTTRRALSLTDAQRIKLTAIETVFEKDEIAAAAISMNLIDTPQWLRGTLCLYPVSYYAAEFGLSYEQVRQIELLRQPFNALIEYKRKQRAELLSLFPLPATNSDPLPSPEIVALDVEIRSLMSTEQGARPPRNLVWNVFNASQKALFDEFATSLEQVNEAIELGLLKSPSRGEPLCP